MLGNIKVMCRGLLHTCFDTGILVAINKPKNAVLEVNDMRIKCEMVKKVKILCWCSLHTSLQWCSCIQQF